MRLVLDTNVVVSALVWGGTPYRLLQAAAAGDIELCASPALLLELHEALHRQPLALRLEMRRSSVERAIVCYAELVIRASPLATPRIVLDDPDDDHVIAAAIGGAADLIVSGDRHLLSIANHEGIEIVRPTDAVSRIGI